MPEPEREARAVGSGGGDDDVEGCDRAAATFLTIDPLGSRAPGGSQMGDGLIEADVPWYLGHCDVPPTNEYLLIF